jgi:gliding motility-associated protein GldL
MNITELVQSPKYKKAMGYVYGWGAAVVLIGALFKIQHYPGAGYFLVIGLLTEALIFFLSAFEPVHEETDWSIVYPELAGLEPRETIVQTKGGAGGDVSVEGLEKLQELLEKISVEPDKISHLSQGLAKLTNTADNLANLADAANATDGYVQTLQKASESVGEFSDKYVNSTESISVAAQKLSASYDETAETISASGKDFAGKVSASSENCGEYNASMEEVNKNLSALNAIYELQLKQTDEQMKNAKTLHTDMDKVLQTLAASLDNAQVYKKETEQLNNNLSALNTVYGNMLSAMNGSKK